LKTFLTLIAFLVALSPLTVNAETPSIVSYFNLETGSYLAVREADVGSGLRAWAKVAQVDVHAVAEGIDDSVIIMDDPEHLTLSEANEIGATALTFLPAVQQGLTMTPAMIVMMAQGSTVYTILYIAENLDGDMLRRYAADVLRDGIDADPPPDYYEVTI